MQVAPEKSKSIVKLYNPLRYLMLKYKAFLALWRHKRHKLFFYQLKPYKGSQIKYIDFFS